MVNLQAVVLAAGKSSRFYPFSNGKHKTMIHLMGKPILAYTVEGIRKAGIREIIMLVREDGVVQRYFGDGGKFGIKIKYVIQKEPLGMGDALLRVEKDIKGDFILLGGNHVNNEILIRELINKKRGRVDGSLMVKRRVNPWGYGVVALRKERVLSVVEKPKKGTEPSNLCLVSVYYLPLEFLSILKKTQKHQYSFEEALDNFVKEKYFVVLETSQEITTLKYPWDLLAIKNYLLQTVKKYIGKKVKIAKSVEITGEVMIEDGTVIMEGVHIKGPAYIGKNVVIGNNVLLRNGVDIEEEAVIGAYLEVKNSLIMKGSTTHSGFIGDSLIGEDCKIGAQFCTANVRLDRETVKAGVLGEKVDTGFKYLGVIMGDNVRVGIKSSTMPGIIIGENAIIGPATIVSGNVEEDTKYYSKFQEVISKKMTKQKIVLFDIDYTLFDTDQFKKTDLQKHLVYNEVYDVLAKISKIAKLGIFSEGQFEFQKAKLIKTNIQKYFDKAHIFIVRDKDTILKNVLNKYKKDLLFLVDDKLTVLHKAKILMPSIFTVWVKRGVYAEAQKPIENFTPDTIIDNLQDLVSIINSN